MAEKDLTNGGSLTTLHNPLDFWKLGLKSCVLSAADGGRKVTYWKLFRKFLTLGVFDRLTDGFFLDAGGSRQLIYFPVTFKSKLRLQMGPIKSIEQSDKIFLSGKSARKSCIWTL